MNGSINFFSHVESPFDGPMNMAIDQAIAEMVEREGQPCLRLYRWSQPTLSLGYFQQQSQRRGTECLDRLPCVRRATGGGAIVHDRELTYSWIVPARRSERGANRHVYRMMHDVIIELVYGIAGVKLQRYEDCLSAWVPNPHAFLCFERRSDEDLLCDGYKVVGSAQRRVGSALLQHGSLLLQTSTAAPSLPGIFTLAGTRVRVPEIADRFATLMERTTGLKVVAAEFGDALRKRANHWVETRFGSGDWTNRR